MNALIGVDVGATTTSAGVVASDEEVLTVVQTIAQRAPAAMPAGLAGTDVRRITAREW